MIWVSVITKAKIRNPLGQEKHSAGLHLQLTLDGHREEVNVLEGLDLVLLDQASELGHGHPLLVVVARASASAATSPSTVTAAPAEPTAS